MENAAYVVIAVLCLIFLLGCMYYFINRWCTTCSHRVGVIVGAHAGFAVDTTSPTQKRYKNYLNRDGPSASMKESRLGKDRSILKSGPYAVV